MARAGLRAISPVVAVLLLILVAVGAAVLIYLWLTGFTGQATQTPSSLQTEFKIETARIYNGTGGESGSNATVEIYVRNTGRTSIDLRALAKQNGLAVYIYNSYTGDLVYSNTTLLFKNGEPRTVPDTNFKDDYVAIYDNNQNGVWEPGELLIIKFGGVAKVTNVDNKLWLNSTTTGTVGLGCGQYYDIKVVIAGQSDIIRDVRVNCAYSNLG